MRSDVQSRRVTAAIPASVTVAVAVVMLGAAGACWAVAVRQMTGMDMGTATPLGSFWLFMPVWVAMMAAMMLPGAIPAAVRRAQDGGGLRAVPLFLVSYLAVWTLGGVVLYAEYRPHGTAVAGGAVVAAGLYELTPLKRQCRRRCRESFRSGLGFGVYCVGSSAGLMLMLVALGVMSRTWMVVAAVLAAGQKVLPSRHLADVPLALAIVGLGALVLFAPAALPGLTPPM
jgi:predicted metal-binding membrane protein